MKVCVYNADTRLIEVQDVDITGGTPVVQTGPAASGSVVGTDSTGLISMTLMPPSVAGLFVTKTFSDSFTVDGAFTVTGTTTLQGNATLDANLNVQGTSSFSGNVAMNAALQVSGTTTLSATMINAATTVNGALTVTGTQASLDVEGPSTLHGDVTVENSNLSVTSNGQLLIAPPATAIIGPAPESLLPDLQYYSAPANLMVTAIAQPSSGPGWSQDYSMALGVEAQSSDTAGAFGIYVATYASPTHGTVGMEVDGNAVAGSTGGVDGIDAWVGTNGAANGLVLRASTGNASVDHTGVNAAYGIVGELHVQAPVTTEAASCYIDAPVGIHQNDANVYGLLAKGGRMCLGPTVPPSTSSSSGRKGEIAYDANYMYICVATNTWKRVALASF